ncbi:hypothetical protein C8R46DRAFT_241087 [Mycena filopes]|nr:hypothetical protein C8R46DRAFT_241087 [Mycena filopes]
MPCSTVNVNAMRHRISSVAEFFSLHPHAVFSSSPSAGGDGATTVAQAARNYARARAPYPTLLPYPFPASTSSPTSSTTPPRPPCPHAARSTSPARAPSSGSSRCPAKTTVVVLLDECMRGGSNRGGTVPRGGKLRRCARTQSHTPSPSLPPPPASTSSPTSFITPPHPPAPHAAHCASPARRRPGLHFAPSRRSILLLAQTVMQRTR